MPMQIKLRVWMYLAPMESIISVCVEGMQCSVHTVFGGPIGTQTVAPEIPVGYQGQGLVKDSHDVSSHHCDKR
jgi:hypothetical protein